MTDWGDGVETVSSSSSQAIENAKRRVDEWVTETKSDAVMICLSDPGRRYFRHDVYPLYKSHRSNSRKPVDLTPVKEFLRDNYPSRWKPKLEADDVLGILATHPTLIPGEKVIATSDKDLNQIPGLHWNYRYPVAGVVTVDDKRATDYFWTQCLSGDPTDGYPGCPGIGPKKAERLVHAFPELSRWEVVQGAYAQRGKDEDFALSQARCACILQYTDYDFVKKEPILWNPLPRSA